jgi:hypothetical protein
VSYQKKYDLKLVNELNQYDNVIINVANEPWFFDKKRNGFSSPAPDESKAWVKEVSEWIVDEEKNLPKNTSFMWKVAKIRGIV